MRAHAALVTCILLALCLAFPAMAARRRKPPAGAKPAAAKPAPAIPAVVDAETPSYADHVPIHYHAEGKGAPALVLIHCWGCDSSDWDNQVPALAATHRVVTLDLAGFGTSGRERKAWTMTAFGADVKAVVEALRLDKVVLVGHSMGGTVMLEAARIMPEHVLGMIAVDCLHDADQKHDPKERQAFLDGLKADFRGRSAELVHFIAGKNAPEVAERYVKQLDAVDPAAATAMLGELQGYDTAAGFRRVANIPLVAIQSTAFPTNVEGNRKYLKHYDALFLPEGVGHYPQYESPAALNELLAKAVGMLTAKR